MANRVMADRRKTELLGKSGLFASLSPSELDVVAGYCDIRRFETGTPIFRQGGEADELFIVDEGAVIVRKTAGDGRDQDLARFTRGEVFGEVDLLDTVPRSASAYAEEPTTVLVFPAGDLPFRDLVERHPKIFASVLHTLLATVAHRIRAANRLISDRTSWIRELRRQLYRDKLTGLHNRSYLDDELDALLRLHPRTTLLASKPDNFKAINDTYGHEAGDRTLVMLAEAVRGLLAEGEVGARYRGDEYCLILTGSDEVEGRRRAQGLRKAIGGLDLRAVTGGSHLKLTVSIGLATHPDQAGDGKTLVIRAMERMLEARKSGGDRILGSERP